MSVYLLEREVGNAVKRNEVKERFVQFDRYEPRISPAIDFIIIARCPSTATCSSKEIYSNLAHVLKLAKSYSNRKIELREKGKRVLLLLGILSLVVVLSACGATGEVNAQSTGIWDPSRRVLFCRGDQALSFGNAGIGIILFTLIIRVILMPLMHFKRKACEDQELQPKIKHYNNNMRQKILKHKVN